MSEIAVQEVPPGARYTPPLSLITPSLSAPGAAVFVVEFFTITPVPPLEVKSILAAEEVPELVFSISIAGAAFIL